MALSLKKKLIETDHPVGVAKQCRYELPPESWVYGMPVPKDKEDAGVLLHSWKYHQPSPGKNTKTNKTFSEVSQTKHDVVYGIKARVSTPINTIITNEYGNKAERELRKAYVNIVEEQNEPKRLITHVTPHYKILKERNRLLRNKQSSPAKPVALYKSKLFQNVESKVKEDIKKFKTYGMKHK